MQMTKAMVKVANYTVEMTIHMIKMVKHTVVMTSHMVKVEMTSNTQSPGFFSLRYPLGWQASLKVSIICKFNNEIPVCFSINFKFPLLKMPDLAQASPSQASQHPSCQNTSPPASRPRPL